MVLLNYRDKVAQEFVFFLKRNNALRPFVRNINVTHTNHVKNFVISLPENKLHSLVDIAFDWHQTKEDYDFWEDIHRTWSSFFTINKIKWYNISKLKAKPAKYNSIW